MSSPYQLSLGAFYFADARRLTSREVDLGLAWRTGTFNGPTFRAAWLEATGEIYLMQHEGLPGGGHVEVIAVAPELDDVLARLEGYELVCGDLGSLSWLLDRLDPRPALAPAPS
jgi:hypothetical protein